MASNLDEKLESGISDVKSNSPVGGDKGPMGSLIIYRGQNQDTFFQFAATTDYWLLDYPVIPENENNADKAEKMRQVVHGIAEEVRDGQYEDGLQAELDPETDFVALSKQIIDVIWPNCETITTETTR